MRLDHVADNIIVGIQTSADHIYHLKRIRPGVYESRAVPERIVEVLLEDAIMRPLISGTEADRYVELATDTYLLFPYEFDEPDAPLILSPQLQRDFPLAFRYLQQHEVELRGREGGSFDDEQWYRFGRNQNIDKQSLPKLAVPRLIIELFCSIDRAGLVCLDNVDVGGILIADEVELLYVATLLNSPVLNFVWRRLSKPFQNDYRSANKQFIAPLPIPHASLLEKQWLAGQALELTTLHTDLRRVKEDIDHRLEVCENQRRSEDWVLPTVGSIEDWKRKASQEMAARQRTHWAKERRSRQLSEELASLQTRLLANAHLRPQFENGELSIDSGGTVVIDRVFVSADEGPFLLAQWKLTLWKLKNGAAPVASKVVDLLRSVKLSGNPALKAQVVQLTEQASAIHDRINIIERELNDRIAELYHLTPDERAIMAAG